MKRDRPPTHGLRRPSRSAGTVAAAKEPAVVHQTAVLAVVGGEIEQPKLAWLHPQTLRQLKRGVLKLGGAFAVVLSPSRARAVAGSPVLASRSSTSSE